MQLTGKQVQQIQDALLGGFSTKDDLRMMVRLNLEQHLDAIVGGDNLRVVIFNLVTWAEQNDRVDDLIRGACAYNPDNKALQQLRLEWRAALPIQAAAQPVAAATLGPPAGRVSIDVFLSYSRKDLAIMRTVRDSLREADLSVWTDDGLEPGTHSWQDAITEAISQAKALAVLLSPDANASMWVKREISFSQARGKRVFPLLIAGDETTSVPLSLIDAQWVDGREDMSRAVRQDFRPALLRYLGRAESLPPEEPIVLGDIQPSEPTARKPIEEQPISSPMLATHPVEAQAVGDKSSSKPDTHARGPAVTAEVDVADSSPPFEVRPEEGGISGGSRHRWAYYVVPVVAVIAIVSAIWWYSMSNRTSTPPAAAPAGTIWSNPKDGAEYVYVPAGSFKMGSGEGDSVSQGDEMPQTSVNVDGFWIMRTEVTNGQYKRCVEDNQACKQPGNERWNDPAYVDHSVTYVDWYQANDYAAWAGGRLPTEAEWEKACRGTDGLIYPWGNSSPTADLANFNNNLDNTAPVGKYSPQGDSPYGLADMAGNVWEWTSSRYGIYPYDAGDGREDPEGDADRMLRGGSLYDNDYFVRCAYRGGSNPGSGGYNIGFRVVTPGS